MEQEGPVRRGFTSALDDVDAKVNQLFALVTESLVAATESFLAADRDEARQVVDRDDLIDRLEKEIESIVERTMLFQAPVASDFHRLLTALRIVPELERSGDLAEHIASRAATGLTSELPPTVRGIIEQLGQQVAAMWRTAADAWADHDGALADRLAADDEVVNTLHEQLTDALVASEPPTRVAMEMALIARFYERLGDHAKHIAKRIPAKR